MMFKPEYVQHFKHDNDDLLVVNAARCSMGKQKTVFDEGDARLIRYLANHQHKSPSYHPHFCYIREMYYEEYMEWCEQTEESQFVRMITDKDEDDKVVTFLERGSLFAYLFNGFIPLQERNNGVGIKSSVSAIGVVRTLDYIVDVTQDIFTDTGLYDLYRGKFTHEQLAKFQTVTMRFEMPVVIAREWYRHCIQKYPNEISRRYVSTEPTFMIPDEWRMAAKDKKQGSSDEVVPINSVVGYLEGGEVWLDGFYELAISYYNNAITMGVAPEMARFILPQSMYTTFVETANLKAYARMAKLRTTPDAQLEVRDYANRVSEIMAELFPVSWKALMEH